jgi:hypothetical protein
VQVVKEKQGEIKKTKRRNSIFGTPSIEQLGNDVQTTGRSACAQENTVHTSTLLTCHHALKKAQYTTLASHALKKA